MIKRFVVLLLFPLSCMVCPTSAYYGSVDCYPACYKEQFDVGCYGWFPWFDGTLTIRGVTASLNTDPVDLVEESDSVAIWGFHTEFQNYKCGAYFDGAYGKLTFLKQPGPSPFTIDVELEMFLAEFGGRYQLCQWGSGDCCSSFDAVVGGRYTRSNTSFEISSGETRSDTMEWIDPIVGARFSTNLAPCWDFIVQGDVGGFGAGSDFSWHAVATTQLRFGLCGCQGALTLGYRALYQDYKKASGLDRQAVHLTQHGPTAGFAFIF